MPVAHNDLTVEKAEGKEGESCPGFFVCMARSLAHNCQLSETGIKRSFEA
jgi:hypothetical protein